MAPTPKTGSHTVSISPPAPSTLPAVGQRHLLPKWGKCPLGTLTSGKIDAWVVQLHREGVLSSALLSTIFSR